MDNNSQDDFWTMFIFALTILTATCIILGYLSIKAMSKKPKAKSFGKIVYTLNSSAISKPQKSEKLKPEQKKKGEKSGKKKETAVVKPLPCEDDNFYVQVTVPILRVRSGPSTKFSKIRNFVKGIVVEVKEVKRNNKEVWYKIKQPAWIRYPKRISGPWFIAGEYNGEKLVRKIMEEKEITVFPDTKPKDKLIKVSLSKQKLQALEKNRVVFEALVSTGLKIRNYNTPIGNFRILRKELSVYMQGPLPHDNDFFDLPGVPFTMYFTKGGAAIHGTYWHHDFGHRHSHGCINLPVKESEWLFWWANVGTPVIIRK